jgi:hypothetical protein
MECAGCILTQLNKHVKGISTFAHFSILLDNNQSGRLVFSWLLFLAAVLCGGAFFVWVSFENSCIKITIYAEDRL